MMGTWNDFPKELTDLEINGIISKSSIKIGAEQTQAGYVYELTLDLGIKDIAGRTRQKLGPQAGNILMANQEITEEFLKLVDQELEELAKKLENPYELIQDFLDYNRDKYQQRAADEYFKRKGITLNAQALDELSEEAQAEIESEAESLNTMAAYHVLNSPYGKQLIDHPYIVSALEKHVQQRYKDLVTLSFEKWDKKIKEDGAIPSLMPLILKKSLKKDSVAQLILQIIVWK